MGARTPGSPLIWDCLVDGCPSPDVRRKFYAATPLCAGMGDTLTYEGKVTEEMSWGDRLSYRWQIGNKLYEGSSIQHVFDSAGTYDIQLQVIRKRLWKQRDTTINFSQAIYPRPRPQAPTFTYLPKRASDGSQLLAFQADSVSSPDLVYRWQIADSVLFGRTVEYPLEEARILSVTLTVYWPGQEDNPTCQVSSSRSIQVGKPREGQDDTPIPAPAIEPLSSEGGNARWAPWLPWAWLALLAVLLGALRPFRRYMRRRRSLSRLKEQFQAGDQPPYTLPLPSQEHLVSPEHEIYSLADALRQRKRGLSDELDIVSSIRATVREAGLPHIRYQERSAPTAYLVLIDRQSTQDHQARLFGMLMKVLQEEDVQIENFYFDGDPRFCYAEAAHGEIPLRLNLDQLYQRYGDRRLLIFADTEVVAHPTRARLSTWAEESLLRWGERIWLTPRPTAEWGYTDLLVYRTFILLTADLSSQLQLVESLSNEQPDYFQLRELARESQPAIEEDLYSLEGLRKYLGEDLLQWVAATTVHPEPRWEVTLSIGKALDEAHCFSGTHPLLSYEHLYRLSKIEWLQDGMLPNSLKRELAAILNKEVELYARTAVLTLLEEVNLPDESFARQEHQIQMAVQRAILRPQDRQAQRELLYLWENGLIKTPIPEAIRRQKRNNRLILLLYALLAISGAAWLQHSLPPEGLEAYPFVIPPDPLAQLNNQGLTHFEQGDFAGALAAYSAALGVDSSDAAVRHNLELMHYNEGRILYNQQNFRLALPSYLALKTPSLQETYVPQYASGLAWTYIDSAQQARLLYDTLSSLSDSTWTRRKSLLNGLIQKTRINAPTLPEDPQLQRQSSLSDSSQRTLLPFLDHPSADIRSAALALLNSQTRWDSLVAERIPNLLNDPAPTVQVQAAIALLAHPPLEDSLLSQIQGNPPSKPGTW